MSPNSNFRELLSTFNDYGVKYLVVGGYAVMLYGEPRFTNDLDVWVEATAENAFRVFRALAAFGAPLAGVTPEDFASEGLFYQMGRPPVRVDILTSIDGVRFAEAWERRKEAGFDGVPVPFLSLPDLIANKKTTARAQDLADVERLEAATAQSDD